MGTTPKHEKVMERMYKLYLHKAELYDIIATVKDSELAENLISQVEAQEQRRVSPYWAARKKDIDKEKKKKEAKQRYKANKKKVVKKSQNLLQRKPREKK